MNLRDLCSTFSALRLPRLGEAAHPNRDAILQLRATLGNALAGEELLLDGIAHELAVIAQDTTRRSLVPFHRDPEFGVRFAFGYWPPGHGTGAHEHTAWTISAVCHNHLRIATFDRAESYRRRELVPKNLFEAEDRAVGYIYEPAIHAPMNPSRAWSLSLHVGSPRDGEPVADCEPLACLTSARPADQAAYDRHPYARAVRARISRLEADLMVRVLLSMTSPRARTLLATCGPMTSSQIRAVLRRAAPDAVPARTGPRRLARVTPALRFHVARDAAEYKVIAETPFGARETLCINDAARDAFEFAAASPGFDVSDLPGELAEDERAAIADTLEDIGFFKEEVAA